MIGVGETPIKTTADRYHWNQPKKIYGTYIMKKQEKNEQKQKGDCEEASKRLSCLVSSHQMNSWWPDHGQIKIRFSAELHSLAIVKYQIPN